MIYIYKVAEALVNLYAINNTVIAGDQTVVLGTSIAVAGLIIVVVIIVATVIWIKRR